jgi:1-acyl-sn-glycerol-3-phosphate acyltransferase
MLKSFLGLIWAIFIASTIMVANVLFVCVAPLAFLMPGIYKRFARTVPAMLWPSLVWSLETWSGNRLHFYGEEPESEESAIVIANHQFYCGS